MTRVGVTGHSNLADDTVRLVACAVEAALAGHAGAELTGVTCLARGADQVFARVVLGLGGAIEVVLPSADYRERKVKPGNAAEFDALLGRAAAVHTMPFARSNRDAYLAASEHLLSTIDALVAVWDGGPSGGLGGTADVVDAATRRRIPVTVVWPVGARRD